MKKNYSYLRIIRICVFMAMICTALFAAVPVSAKNHSTTYKGQDYSYVYDYTYYTTYVHPEDAGKKDATVLYHFITKSMPKGEQGIASFNVKSYYYGNQDLRLEYGKDWTKYYLHYQNTGHSVESRVKTATGITKLQNPVTIYNGFDYSKVYNYNYYLAKHPSVAKQYVDDDYAVLKHYVTYGIAHEYKSSPNFYAKSYRYGNPDLRAKYGTKYRNYVVHYCKYGYKNRQSTATGITSLKNPITSYNGVDYSAIYDFNYYVSHNSAAAKYKDDDYGAIKHFITTGILMRAQAKEGVSPTSSKYTKVLYTLYPNAKSDEYAKAYKYSSNTNWLILLDQGNHLVHIFKGNQSTWTKIKSFSCCVGKQSTPTPVGVYTIGDRGTYFWTGSNKCWYYTQITGSILFHSIIYNGYSTPSYVVDGRLGLSISHGCVRLAIANAKWIYDTIPRGTKVVSYNRPW